MYIANAERYDRMQYNCCGASGLIGASKVSQILDNVGMLGNLQFSEAEREKIDQILE